MEKASVVSIGKRVVARPYESNISKLAIGPIVDTFFAVAAVFALMGIGYLGIHAWMMRNGFTSLHSGYATIRAAHIYIQLNGFVGFIILGFSLQAGTMLFGFPGRARPGVIIFCGGSLAVGTAFLLFEYTNFIGALLVSTSFLVCAAESAVLMHRAKARWYRVPLLVFVSLTALAISPHLNVAQLPWGLVAIWWTFGAAFFAAGPLFIANLLGGQHLSIKQDIGVVALYIACGIALVWGAFSGSPEAYRLAGVLALVTLGFTLYFARAWVALRLVPKKSLALSLIAALFWSILGSVMLVYEGTVTDSILHVWAAGWITSAIFGVSMHILSFIADTAEQPSRLAWTVLLTWQGAVISRGVVNFGAFNSAAGATLAGIAVLSWVFFVFHARRQIRVKRRAIFG